MDRKFHIQALVLNTITDDYEEIDHIWDCINRWYGMDVSYYEIVKALSDLIEHGWATAYILHPRNPLITIKGKPKKFSRCYFWITPAGITELKSLPEELFPQLSDLEPSPNID